MGYLRPAQSAYLPVTPGQACLEAFGRDLDYVFATLRRLGAGPPDVEDLAQEVFVVLHHNWPSLDTTRSLRPYLFSVAFRVSSAHRRRRRREIPYAVVEVEDVAANAEGMLRSKEMRALLLAALERVPLQHRVVVVMHELEEIPVTEIARRLSLTQLGAYTRLRKGRQELQAAVRKLRGGEPR